MFIDPARLNAEIRADRRRRRRELEQLRRDGLVFNLIAGWPVRESVPKMAGQFRRPRDNLADSLGETEELREEIFVKSVFTYVGNFTEPQRVKGMTGISSCFRSDSSDEQSPNHKSLLDATNRTLRRFSTVVPGRGLAYCQVVSIYGRPGHHRGTERRENTGISSHRHASRHDSLRCCFLIAAKTEGEKHVS
jgi:hypothetical protein